MIPVFNEHQYAVNMNNGYATDRHQDDKRKYNYRELLIYTKWLYWNIFKDHNDADRLSLTRTALVTFCNQLLSNFNEDLDYRMIENLVNRASIEKIRSNNAVCISQNEKDQIMKLPTNDARRLYFAILIIAKYNRNNPIETINASTVKQYSDQRLRLSRIVSYNELRKFAGIKLCKAQCQEDADAYERPLLDLKQYGLIEEYVVFGSRKYNRFKAGIILTQANYEPLPTNTILTITHCYNFEDYFQFLMGDSKYRICPKCGNAFRKIYNRTKYCDECARQIGPKVYKICLNCGRRFESIPQDTRSEYCKECHAKILKGIKNRWYLNHKDHILE